MSFAMLPSNSFPACARFDQFQVDFRSAVLQRSGVRVPLQAQPLQVLRLLLQAEGKVVTREELRKVLWPEDTFVDFELGVNTAVKKLRQALAETAEGPKFIETLPRIGYRFMVPVEWLIEDAHKDEAAGVASAPEHDGRPTPPPPQANLQSVTKKRLWLAVGATTFILLSTSAIWRLARNYAEASMPPIEVLPLVGLPGMESDPAFSPDGNHVAFSIHGPENPGIYTTVLGGEKSLRLTSNSDDDRPRWSPDGRRIAFLRSSAEGVAIYVIPAFGGVEHRLYSGPAAAGWVSSLDWSPDGKVLAFTESDANKTHSWIALLSLADSKTRRLTSPSDQDIDYGLAFSPNGSAVAFVRGIVSGVVSDLYVVSSAGGAPRRLTFDGASISGSPAWSRDSRDIVFSSTRGGPPGLWRISVSGGTPRPLVGVGDSAYAPSISPKSNDLVYQHLVRGVDIWRINLKDETHRKGLPAQIISEKGWKGRPHFSPDGKRIAFESDRLGYAEIWTCDSDGSNCRQLTSLHGVAGAASWSPDGRSIAFEFRPKEHSEIYVLELDGGMPRLLTTLPGADNGGPNWSRDGKWIYFYSDRGGSFQLWKIPLNGGPPVQVTNHGGVFAIESQDGRYLYYAKVDTPGIWKMPVQGGEETRVLDQPSGGTAWGEWSLGRNGIYFLNCETQPRATVEFFEFATHKIIPIWTLTKMPGLGLSVAADGSSILYVQNEFLQSDIMWVKNPR